MAPRVSPGKTTEGLAGGLITAGLVSRLFSHYSPLQTLPENLIIVSRLWF